MKKMLKIIGIILLVLIILIFILSIVLSKQKQEEILKENILKMENLIFLFMKNLLYKDLENMKFIIQLNWKVKIKSIQL